jgi:hypothetical protein
MVHTARSSLTLVAVSENAIPERLSGPSIRWSLAQLYELRTSSNLALASFQTLGLFCLQTKRQFSMTDDITPAPGVVCLIPLDRIVLLPTAYVPAAKIERLLTVMSYAGYEPEPIELAPCQGREGYCIGDERATVA